MAQNDLVVVGIDVAKDKVDIYIRRFKLGQTFPNNPKGAASWLSGFASLKLGKAVMEASGNYEREWRNLLHNDGIGVRIVDPTRVRNFALSPARERWKGVSLWGGDPKATQRRAAFISALIGCENSLCSCSCHVLNWCLMHGAESEL